VKLAARHFAPRSSAVYQWFGSSTEEETLKFNRYLELSWTSSASSNVTKVHSVKNTAARQVETLTQGAAAALLGLRKAISEVDED